MDDALAFRNAMAESGTEYTPAQAEGVMHATEEFRQGIHDHCREDPEYYRKLANMTPEQKEQACEELDVTETELDGLIGLVLEVYEDEKLY